ncbi:Protein Lilipod like protein [Argiope bruennichi]|uniref:Protein Lilipod like protein n=2 Tax=Argiope bruennichi TaxID=94029 RepID=A0A8T0FNM5_ARGBR|nr:Protein Lilipod like protein [Argiope bruennichi]
MGQGDCPSMGNELSEDSVIQLGPSFADSPACSLMHRRKRYRTIPFEEYADNMATYLNEEGLDRMVEYLQVKESKVRQTAFKRNCLYPMMMIFLVLLTVMSVLMVTQNTLELCFGIKALPIYSQNISLGINSLSTLGPIGAALEIVLILYLWCTSIIGLYSLPLFCYLKPKVQNTSMTQVIGNCAILLILSSALPVLARSLGITNFDLLGDFGRINWLGNFYIVLFHNIVFAVTTAVCLGTKITATVRNELYLRICNFHRYSMFYVFL